MLFFLVVSASSQIGKVLVCMQYLVIEQPYDILFMNSDEKCNITKNSLCDMVVLGPIWTNIVPIGNVIFFLKMVSYGQFRASRYKLLNLKTSGTS